MTETRDMGLIHPRGPRIRVRKQILGVSGKESSRTNTALDRVITTGEARDGAKLLEYAKSEDPSTRYWAAVWLGVKK